MERPKGSCGQKMRYREVGKKWREESSGILSELCLKMPYKVLMVCRGLPPWPFDDRTRTCLQSMISECSWFSNGIRYCEPQDSPARPVLWTTLKDQGNNGTESGAAAQRWRSTTLVFNEGAFSPLWLWKNWHPQSAFGFPPGQQLQMLQRQAADPWCPGLMKNESPSQRSTIWLSSYGHSGNWRAPKDRELPTPLTSSSLNLQSNAK